MSKPTQFPTGWKHLAKDLDGDEWVAASAGMPLLSEAARRHSFALKVAWLMGYMTCRDDDQIRLDSDARELAEEWVAFIQRSLDRAKAGRR